MPRASCNNFSPIYNEVSKNGSAPFRELNNLHVTNKAVFVSINLRNKITTNVLAWAGNEMGARIGDYNSGAMKWCQHLLCTRVGCDY